MDTSVFIAQLLGLVYLVIGLGMLFSGEYYRKAFEKMVKEPGVMYLGGVMALITGFLILTFHSVWQGWPILVTLIGWLALIKGVLLLLFPEGMMEWSAGFMKKDNFMPYSIFVLVLGAVFVYFGYFA